MALTVTIGSGSITLVQSGPLVLGGYTGVNPTLAVASTAGSLLVAVLIGDQVTAAPAGWIRATSASVGQVTFSLWYYPNNPGGILTVQFTVPIVLSTTDAHISEWANAAYTAPLETSGSATASSGTTLTPTAAAAIINPGDLVIAAWGQALAAPGTVTFTTPLGFTRLVDNGSSSVQGHDDIEYRIAPPVGTIQAPVLTSTGTTLQAAGAVVVFKAAPPSVDQSAYVRDPGPTIKLNTLDVPLMLGGRYMLEDGSGFYQLEDGSGDYILDTYIPQLGDPVVTTNPTWSGRVVSTTVSDLTDRQTNYRLATIAATNSATAVAGTAPVDLSDAPLISYFLLEDGSGDYQLEDGSGKYALEGSTAGYRNLRVQNMQNQDGSTSVYGSLETFEGGFAAGQTFSLTSTNLGYSNQQFSVTNVTTTFVGVNPRTPVYLIEFGDAYPTLQTAGGGVLTRQSSQAVIQAGIVMPAGTLNYQQIIAAQNGVLNLADIAGLAATVTVVAGRRILVRGFVTYTKHTAGLLALDLFEGATQLQQWIISAADGSSYTAHLDCILQPSAGTHTYKLVVGVSAGTADVTASTSLPNFIIVEDIGT